MDGEQWMGPTHLPSAMPLKSNSFMNPCNHPSLLYVSSLAVNFGSIISEASRRGLLERGSCQEEMVKLAVARKAESKPQR